MNSELMRICSTVLETLNAKGELDSSEINVITENTFLTDAVIYELKKQHLCSQIGYGPITATSKGLAEADIFNAEINKAEDEKREKVRKTVKEDIAIVESTIAIIISAIALLSKFF